MKKTKTAIKTLSVFSIVVGVSTLYVSFELQNGSISVGRQSVNAQSVVTVCVGNPADDCSTPTPTPGPGGGGDSGGGGGTTTPPSSGGGGGSNETPGGSTPTNPPSNPNAGEPGKPDTPTNPPHRDPSKTSAPKSWFAALLEPLSQLALRAVAAIRTINPDVARGFPYLLFLLLLLLVIRFMWQAGREARAASRLESLLARQRMVAEEKDTFMALSSHYLLTPLTVMRSGVDTMVSLNELSRQQLTSLINALDRLKLNIDSILEEIQSNQMLKSIPAPQSIFVPDHSLRSPYFLLPVLSVGLLSLCTNTLLSIVGEIDLNTINMLIQGVIFITLCVFLFGALRNRHLKDLEQRRAQQLVDYEAAVDDARNRFIVMAREALHIGLSDVIQEKQKLPSETPSLRFFNEGYGRFEAILHKFNLLSQVQTGYTPRRDTLNLRTEVESAVSGYAETLGDKRLNIINNAESIEIHQNKLLFDFIITSLIDNAIKFTDEGGTITIRSTHTPKQLKLFVSDTGVGIQPDKLSHLFKPFARLGDAEQFDYEGLGFSLFLDKIIVDKDQGSIKAESQPAKGTLMSVTTNL